ncbi:MAG TPA: hypothetical protein VFP54_05955 [Acidimicrobiales bacterium]|nr:hypothetical protein [Acidimicrobiales bacterium]
MNPDEQTQAAPEDASDEDGGRVERRSVLAGPLDGAQLELVRTVWEGWERSGDWPVWDFVEMMLDQNVGLDAREVLGSLPSVSAAYSAPSTYGLVRLVATPGPPVPETRVALTVPGLWHAERNASELRQFLAILDHLASTRRGLKPDPKAPVETTLDGAHLEKVLAGRRMSPMPHAMSVLRYWLNTEPATVGMTTDAGGDDWSVTLRAGLRRFRDVSSVEDYIDRAVDVFQGDVPRQWAPIGAVSLAGPIDHLDAVWQVAFGAPLFGRSGGEVPAILDRDVETTSDLDSHLSALANALNQLRIDGSDPEVANARGPLQKMKVFLRQRLADEPERAGRTDDAIGVLQDIVRIRASRQHADVAAEAVERHRRLGLRYPAPSPAAAWADFSRLAHDALVAIREEIRASPRSDGTT